MKAYLDAWRYTFDYSGITTRRDFVFACIMNAVVSLLLYLFICIVIIVASIIEIPLSHNNVLAAFFVIRILNSFFMFPLLSMSVRRLRDAGYSAKAFFWLLFPCFGVIAFLVRLLAKTKDL